jgi:alanine racemase
MAAWWVSSRAWTCSAPSRSEHPLRRTRPVSAPERALARIDLGAIERNCAHLRSLLAEGTELCAVVKADGYGHGAVWTAKAALAGGATWLAVATAAEVEDLRRHGIGERILVMGALTREEQRVAREAEADVAAWTPEVEGERLHVKLDTGMGRLGTRDWDEAMRLARSDRVVGLMTHFATADEPGDDYFHMQLDRFREFVDAVGRDDLLVHAANSAATLRDRAAHFDLVRCGIAIYGMDPFGEDPAERGLEPALTLHSWVAAVRRFETGESAGYGRHWTASEPSWVATVPIGYGDGWRRALTNNCDVLIGGRRFPVVGTVSMDNVTVDLGAETGVSVGDEVVLIGEQGEEQVLAEEVAERLQTINYEITSALSPRVRRLHVR